MTRRLIGYVRVSTDEQTVSSLGLNAQRAALHAHATLTGDTLVDVVEDAGVSGKTLDRPGLRAVLEALADGQADGIVCSKLDRVSRSLVDFAHLMEWCDEGRLDLVVLDLQLDTAGPMGRFVAHVMAAIAELERGQTSARTTAALAARRERGEPISRPAVIDTYPEIAALIILWRERGLAWQAIADQLNSMGTPTVRGGAEWRVSSVQHAAGYRRPKARRVRADLPVLPSRRRGRTPATR